MTKPKLTEEDLFVILDLLKIARNAADRIDEIAGTDALPTAIIPPELLKLAGALPSFRGVLHRLKTDLHNPPSDIQFDENSGIVWRRYLKREARIVEHRRWLLEHPTATEGTVSD